MRLFNWVALSPWIGLSLVANAADGHILLGVEGTNTVVQVKGDKDDDWWIQTSTDLLSWTNLTSHGPVLSGRTNPPSLSLGSLDGLQVYFRAQRTAGLYDPTLLRTISLTFTQSNWQTLLTSGRTTGSNTVASLTLDNGAFLPKVGARYRGNTSFTGMGGAAPVKKSLNLELDFADPTADLMGYDTLNLNNAYQDETIMRESVYFRTMRKYTVCPNGSLVQLYINNVNWGVYSFAQQQDGRLIQEYFTSSDGDRWRAPNMPAGGGGGPGGGSTGASALGYLGNTNVASYKSNYELKSTYHTNAYPRLINCIYVLNNTPAAEVPDKVEDVLAVDRWLWFLSLENVFADDDSYWNKGADYMIYFEPESGRLHPVEHDGNEAFVAGDAQLSPVTGAAVTTRPVLKVLLSNAELRQRYLAHMRTVLEESFNPSVMIPLIDQVSAMTVGAITADPKKGYTAMSTYTNDLNTLKNFVRQRYAFLTNHAELKPLPPAIVSVSGPRSDVTAADSPFVTAEVRGSGTEGISSVWLYHRAKSYGRFTQVQMWDDGAHGDGVAGDSVYGAATTNYPAGTKVRYYVEARSANTAQAACLSPARAEQETYTYRVATTTAASTPVIISELMALNSTTLADPQGEFDDWIELRNITDQEVDLTGRHLSDEPNNPRKWQFPAGTKIAAGGYLLVWADEDGSATNGLHASFKLSAEGEEIFLTDTDAELNAVLDSVRYGAQEADRSYGRTAVDPEEWANMSPTPGGPNH